MLSTLKDCIDSLLEKRKEVYQAEPNRLKIDARAAHRAAKDYRGRWLWELLQNCEDAQASLVRLVVHGEAIYFADNGSGFKPEAIEAISSTDLSDKKGPTIGRKGVGFKAVFDITMAPRIYSRNDEGLEFNRDRAKNWLEEKAICPTEIPYQWLPFYISRSDAEADDHFLFGLRDFTTVIKLILKEQEIGHLVCSNVLRKLTSANLLPFNYLKRLELYCNNAHCIWEWDRPDPSATGLTVCKLKESDLYQSFEESWFILRAEKETPPELLSSLDPEDQEHAQKISWLVAAPMEDAVVFPTADYYPIHVFYPTRVLGPVPLLLHAEFLVNTERTEILEGLKFNEWVGEELSQLIVRFVQSAYQKESPAAFIRLLTPLAGIERHQIAQKLWDFILPIACDKILLPDTQGNPKLTCGEAIVPPDSMTVRQLLAGTYLSERMVHDDLSQDAEVVNVLRLLGAKVYEPEDILKVINEEAPAQGADQEWLWSAWLWLAQWIGETHSWSEDRKARVAQIRPLLLLPVAGGLKSRDDLEDFFITWEEEELEVDLPGWLPLAFLDSWFAEKIKGLPKKDKLKELLEDHLEIQWPGNKLWKKSLEKAIDNYWRNRESDPERFIHFLLKTNWHEEFEKPEGIGRCPIPVYREGHREFEEAKCSYFGREWDVGQRLEDLWGGNPSVSWAKLVDSEDYDSDYQRDFYSWLGVSSCPKVLSKKDIRIYQLYEINNEYARYVYNEIKGYQEAGDINVSELEYIDFPLDDHKKGILLILFFINNWRNYYNNFEETKAKYRRPYKQYFTSGDVDNLWWYNIKHCLFPPLVNPQIGAKPLVDCWLPDRQVQRILGQFLPIVDLDKFPPEVKDKVTSWLRDVVHLRQGIGQIRLSEWQKILTDLSEKYPPELCQKDENARSRVASIYRACLDTEINPPELEAIRLLSHRGDQWDYLEECWLDDLEEAGQAFKDDVWVLLHPGAGLEAKAGQLSGVKRFSKYTELEPVPGREIEDYSDQLNQELNRVKPFIFIWRMDRGDPEEKLRNKLHRLKVKAVEALKVKVTLEGVGERYIEREYAVIEKENVLYISIDCVREKTWWSELAGALTQALGRKEDQDFYENLLRCKDDAECQAKLRNKGVKEENINGWLNSYKGLEPELIPPPTALTGEEGKVGVKGPPTSGGDVFPPVVVPPSAPTEEEPAQPTRKVEIIDPKEIGPWHAITPPISSLPGTRPSGPTGIEPPPPRPLSEVDKNELELASRAICRKILEADSYQVEEMPLDNPGYDLEANKEGETLMVEVKGHLHVGNVVDLKVNQLIASIEPKKFNPAATAWQLWNVDNLAADSSVPIEVRIYQKIKFDDLEARSFLLNLKTCECLKAWKVHRD